MMANEAKEKEKLTFAKLIEYLKDSMSRSLLHSEHQLVAVGAVGFFGFPLFYFVWTFIYPQMYETLSLRIVGAILCGGLMLKPRWPNHLLQYLPYYWYITILYTLPFFFSFIFFKNQGSEIAAMSMLVAVFLLILLVDWISLIILSSIGISLAWLAYYFTTATPHLPHNLWQYVAVYLFTVIAGTIFNYKTALLQLQKQEGMASVISNVAHELRTPLLGIKGGISGLQRYFPILTETYEQAKEAGMDVPHIRRQRFTNLIAALDRMDDEVAYANTTIDMLLINIGKQDIDIKSLAPISMVECVNEALKLYPFDSAEHTVELNWEDKNDFIFLGSKLLLIHILFNLLKNAFHFIVKQDKKGDIRIWLEKGKTWNELHFKDTGEGISPDVLPRIFDRFYTTTLTGTGIGLSFCQMVMQKMGGNIACKSELGEYTEFILRFPVKLLSKEIE